MLISVGSINPTKVATVRITLGAYPELFEDAQVEGVVVASSVSEQPLSMEEIIRGARHRARSSFRPRETTYSIGIENGLNPTPYVLSGYLDHCVCSIYRGRQNEEIIGISSGFELPPHVVEYIILEKVTIDVALHVLGLSEDARIGYKDGVIGLLSNGHVCCMEQIQQAIRNALFRLQRPDLYERR